MRPPVSTVLYLPCLVVAAGLLHSPQAPAGASVDQALPAATVTRPFTRYDSAAAAFLGRGIAAKDAARRIATDPENADLPRLLVDRSQFDAALVAIRRIIDTHPDRIAQAFRFESIELRSDTTHNYATEMLALVALARKRLPELPHEEAAATARVLLNTESQFDRHPRDAWVPTLKAFAAEYAGTDAALLTDVDVIILSMPLSAAQSAALDAFVEQHPHTVAAAKAVYQHGWDLAVNASAFRPSRMSDDPTARFADVQAIALRLESGEFPPCEWVRKASEFVIQFSTYGAKYSSSDHIDAMLAGYRDLVRRELPKVPGGRLADSSLEFVINTKMGDLYELRGNRIGGIEGILAELERDAPNPVEIRFARALMYLRYLVEPTPDRPAILAKSISALRAVHAEGVEPFSSEALATLAAVHFFNRDYAAARPVYAEYLAQYPASAWAWLAHVRLGQSLTALDDIAGAAKAFAAAAAAGDTPPAARVVALAFSADALAELGQVKDALRDARLALDTWDDDFGQTYRTQASQAARPGARAAIDDDTTITKAGLRARVAELTVSAATPGGALLEQSRRMIARRHTAEAVTFLRRAVTTARGTATERVARSELHHAQLLEALSKADVERPGANPAAALSLLDGIIAEPVDFHVFAARIAKATIEARQPEHAGAADTIMIDAFRDWRTHQPRSSPPAAGSLDADVAGIRAEVFRPLGGGVYGSTRWNAFDWPAQLPPFIIANPDIVVKLAPGDSLLVSLRVPIAGLDNLIFVNNAEFEVLAAMMTSLGGTRRREPTAIMQTPNQPAGAAVDVSVFWNRYFPMRPGHWSGWEFATYPTITDITFVDAARTKAAARVTVGYSGGTVVLEKIDGAWRARELVGVWIT